MEPTSQRILTWADQRGRLDLYVPGLVPGEAVEVTVRRVEGDWDAYLESDAFQRMGPSREQIDEVFLAEREAWEG